MRGTAWALGMPLIILGGIYSGIVTATEAAAVSVVYAVFVEAAIFRALSFRKFMMIAQRSAVLTSMIFMLLAAGSVLVLLHHAGAGAGLRPSVHEGDRRGAVPVPADRQHRAADRRHVHRSGYRHLVLMPALFPVAVSLGIDPVHFGLVVCVTACTGMITPPFGLDLFVASSTLNKPVVEITRGVWQFIVANIVVLLIVTYVPGIATFLPNLLFGPAR